MGFCTWIKGGGEMGNGKWGLTFRKWYMGLSGFGSGPVLGRVRGSGSGCNRRIKSGKLGNLPDGAKISKSGKY